MVTSVPFYGDVLSPTRCLVQYQKVPRKNCDFEKILDLDYTITKSQDFTSEMGRKQEQSSRKPGRPRRTTVRAQAWEVGARLLHPFEVATAVRAVSLPNGF